jgi:hypothetical protein
MRNLAEYLKIGKNPNSKEQLSKQIPDPHKSETQVFYSFMPGAGKVQGSNRS